MSDAPKPAVVDVAESVAGDAPVEPDGGGADIATLVKDAVSETFNKLLGRHDDLVSADDGDDDLSGEPVTAKGKTAEARAARGPSREESVAEQTRAELAKVRREEKREDENAELRAEIEDMKGKLTALAEEPPKQYSRISKALWG